MKQITEKEFKELYQLNTITKMAEILGVSRVTIYNWVNKIGLDKKRISLIKG